VKPHAPAVFALLLALAALLAGLALAAPGERPLRLRDTPASLPVIRLDPPIGGGALVWPVGLTHAGDARLFVVEQPGRIRIISGTQVLAAPFLDVSALVTFYAWGEEGLLGLAFHPDYAANGAFYIYYTDTGGDLQLSRYTRSASDPNLADPASRFDILKIPHPDHGNHNGGQLAFGPGGYLYLGPGDGGSAGDPPNNAQNRGVLLGKLLRIDVNAPAPTPYVIPTTNPFVGDPAARGEIWSWGLRNPWRFSFDRMTGDLYIGDVGQADWEEIDVEPAGSPGGVNYGWRLWEGRHCYNPPANCTPTPGATPFYPWATPVAEYWSNDGECTVIGGAVYRGARYPTLLGTYFFGDFCSGRIWGLWPGGPGGWTVAALLDTERNITSFGEDAAGELYVLSPAGVQPIRGLSWQVIAPVMVR
jgi:hypothetical protein